jgi:hypothetical protein
MKAKLTAMLALACLVTVSAKVSADDHDGDRKTVPVFSVVYLDDVEPRSEKARIKSMATRSRVAALQSDIAADPALHRKLTARGVPIRHIIARQKAFNGAWVFYVR